MSQALGAGVAATLIALASAGCASDFARVTDMQVRSGDRPECQLSWRQGGTVSVSGAESRYDPCGNSGTFPIVTSERLRGSPGD